MRANTNAGVSRWNETGPCPRCGVTRWMRADRPALCRDCREALTVNERKVWAA